MCWCCQKGIVDLGYCTLGIEATLVFDWILAFEGLNLDFSLRRPCQSLYCRTFQRGSPSSWIKLSGFLHRGGWARLQSGLSHVVPSQIDLHMGLVEVWDFPLCVQLIWFFRAASSSKVTTQTLHLNGFFPSWTVPMWFFKSSSSMNWTLQVLHFNIK